MSFCPYCGRDLSGYEGAVFCFACGAKLSSGSHPAEEDHQTAEDESAATIEGDTTKENSTASNSESAVTVVTSPDDSDNNVADADDQITKPKTTDTKRKPTVEPNVRKFIFCDEAYYESELAKAREIVDEGYFNLRRAKSKKQRYRSR